MSVGLLIIGHERVPGALRDTAVSVLAKCPLPASTISVAQDREPDDLARQIQSEIDQLDEGDGILMMVDMFGSTLSNVARRFVDKERVMMVSGVNVPMVIRVMNYADLSLAQLTDKAVSGGRDGVFECDADHDG